MNAAMMRSAIMMDVEDGGPLHSTCASFEYESLSEAEVTSRQRSSFDRFLNPDAWPAGGERRTQPAAFSVSHSDGFGEYWASSTRVERVEESRTDSLCRCLRGDGYAR